MPAKTKSATDLLESVYESLHQLLSRYAPPLKTTGGGVRGKKDLRLIVPKPVTLPGAYGGKPVHLEVASIILQKGFVGFYFMPIYINPELKSKVPPVLLKLLKGKTCFHIQKLDPELLASIQATLDEGAKCYKARGWL